MNMAYETRFYATWETLERHTRIGRQFKRNVIPFQAGCSTKEYLGTVYPSCYLRGLVMFRVYSGAFTSLLNQEQRGNVYRDAMALAK